MVRLSGDGAVAVGERLVRGLGRRGQGRRLRLCKVVHPTHGEVLDQAMVCIMIGPRSYTGEDVVELQTHGGPATVAAVIGACLEAGARMASPGEFTLRAFLNGRMDLAEAEAVAGLVGAQSERARRVALRQLHGGLGEVLGNIRRACVEVLAEVEARLDFPDDELEDLPVEPLILRLDDILGRLDALLSQAPAGRLAREGARVVLLGRPNVGKSSLLNALVGRHRAIVHSSPGTTRDWLEDELSLGGLRLTIVDTAGQRPGTEDDPAEAMGAQIALDQALHADLVLLVISLVEGITSADQRLLSQLGDRDVAVVLNQIDLVDDETLDRAADQAAARGLLVMGRTSATGGDGVSALTDGLRNRFDGGEVAFEELPLVSEKRHEESLRLARGLVVDARRKLRRGRSEELVALDIREATVGLSSITGEGVTEDVLEQIFSRFCIGK